MARQRAERFALRSTLDPDLLARAFVDERQQTRPALHEQQPRWPALSGSSRNKDLPPMMAASGDLIDFEVIEGHKENIQALPSGRSAKALAQLYSPPLLGAQPTPSSLEDAHSAQRAKFEQELARIDEADDPLEVYDRYVKWTMDTYPSAQATPQSRLLPLLERTTKTFQSSSHYKNDPRYLKIWLHYIRLFSDAPREAFVFLARQGIGESLALYYEEFAAWLENAGRWMQADEIYARGIEKEARPVERLLRKFSEFEQRKQARQPEDTEPSSPVLPTARPALAAKVDPFTASIPEATGQQQARSTASKRAKGSKMAVFADQDESSRPSSENSAKGWDNIGTLADRKKENTVEARPWAGEKLQTGKTNVGMPKMMIFRDQSSKRLLPRHIQRSLSRPTHEGQCARNPKSGKLECVFVNLEAVYPNVRNDGPPVEYCFEELRARHRGRTKQELPQPRASDVDIADGLARGLAPEPQPGSNATQPDRESSGVVEAPKQRGFKIFEDITGTNGRSDAAKVDADLVHEHVPKTIALNDENDENAPPREPQDLAKKARKEERANRTRKIKVMDVKHIKNETKTIQLNLDSPTGRKIRRKKSTDRAEPTMTINTKEALDEIYGIFNQPLQSLTEGDSGQDHDEDDEDDSSDEEDDDDDEYSTDEESNATGRLSGPASEYGDETKNELFRGQIPQEHELADDARSEVSEWSDFTTSKHLAKDGGDETSSSTANHITGNDYGDSQDEESVMQHDENPRTRYIPIPPDDYQPPTGQFRDMALVANNRLPYMTPIVEQTESSLRTETDRKSELDLFATKTPSRKTGNAEPLVDDDEINSSPFREDMADMAEDKRRILQPIRTKSTKGTISLGQGSVGDQVAVKADSSSLDSNTKGPLIRDEQCNPMDPHIRQCILMQIQPPLTSYEGYHETLDVTSGRGVELRRFVKAVTKAKTNPEKTASAGTPPQVSLDGQCSTYTIHRELGAGTFAPVYLATNDMVSNMNEEEEASRHHETRVGALAYRKALEAIKMEDPPSTWEFYILRQSHRRLGVSRAAESIVRAHEMHLFRDECFLVEEYRDQGTLLDLVNIARADSGNGGGMDEMLAMFFTVELLRTTEALHAKQLIHGDLKGDNILVRFDDPGMETDWSPTYFPNGAHGWSSKGICLIDFGRGIDMRHFVPHVGFIADWKTTDADCAEMRELRPWTYQIDYYGLAGIVHSLLFGKYMETIAEKAGTLGHGSTKKYRIRENLKRYWQTDLWMELFDLLLNPLARVEAEDGKKMPVLNSMRNCRNRLESWLEENCERGAGLKGMIARMESAVRERRRKGGR